MGLDAGGAPYVVSYIAANDDGWQAGAPLPCPSQQSAFQSLVAEMSADGTFQVIGLDPSGIPYVVSYLSASGGQWAAGTRLPCPSQRSSFHSLVAGRSTSGDLQVIGLDSSGAPYVISYLPAGGGSWQAGVALPCPSQQSSFSSLSIGHANGALQVFGLDASGLPYVVSSLQASDGWQAGSPLPCPSQQTSFVSLEQGVAGASVNTSQGGVETDFSGTVEIIGLGADKIPYVLSYMPQGSGGWQAGSPLPCPVAQGTFASLATGALPSTISIFVGGTNRNEGDFQVVGLAPTGVPYVASYLSAGGGGWQAGSSLPCP